MRVRAGEATMAELGRLADACPWATFFQTPAWLERSRAFQPNHEVRVHALDAGGTEVLWPLLERKTSNGLDVRGNAAGVYGGWIGRGEVDMAAGRAFLSWLDGHAGPLRFRPNPFLPGWSTAADSLGVLHGQRTDESTHLMDLRLTSADAWQRYASGMRRDLHRAERLGVTVRQSTAPADWASFHGLYAASLQRWGKTPNGPDAPEALRSLESAPGARLAIAELDARPLAIVINLRHRDHLLGWKMGSSDEGHKTHAWKVLLHRTIEDARAAGLRWYDFNVSGGRAGSDHYKSLFGAQPRPSPMVQRNAAPARPGPAMAWWRRLRPGARP